MFIKTVHLFINITLEPSSFFYHFKVISLCLSFNLSLSLECLCLSRDYTGLSIRE